MKFHRMKELVCAITELSLDTGYEYEFLCEAVDELLEDGETIETAFKEVYIVAHEHDF